MLSSGGQLVRAVHMSAELKSRAMNAALQRPDRAPGFRGNLVIGFLVYGNGEESAFLFRVQAVHGEAQFIEGDLIDMRRRRSLIGHGIGKNAAPAHASDK